MSRYPTPEDWDHARDLRKHASKATARELLAVTKLVGYAEGIASSGCLSDIGETQLRALIAETLVAFDMPSKAELEHA